MRDPHRALLITHLNLSATDGYPCGLAAVSTGKIEFFFLGLRLDLL